MGTQSPQTQKKAVCVCADMENCSTKVYVRKIESTILKEVS